MTRRLDPAQYAYAVTEAIASVAASEGFADLSTAEQKALMAAACAALDSALRTQSITIDERDSITMQ